MIAKTYWEARVEMVRICLILGTEKNLWVSPELRIYNAPGSNHPFTKRAPGVAAVPITISPPKIWQSGERVPLILLRGYDNERSRNFRLNFDKVSLDTNIKYEVTTWWDTFMYGVDH